MTDAELKEHLAEVTTELYRAGVVTATGGNISVRSSENVKTLWITPSAVSKGSLHPEDMTLIGLDGKILGGKHKPSIEFAFHAGLMKLRADVNAVVHSHAPYSTVWGLGDPDIPPITYEALLVDRLPFISWHMVGSQELAAAVMETVGKGMTPGAFLRNHGLVTVGKDLRQAADATLMVEHTLKILHMAHQLDIKPTELTERAIEQLNQLADSGNH
ncbi:MAG: class II aldolase/adducin family protein [Anaerolineaceae bacterium]